MVSISRKWQLPRLDVFYHESFQGSFRKIGHRWLQLVVLPHIDVLSVCQTTYRPVVRNLAEDPFLNHLLASLLPHRHPRFYKAG